MKRWSALSLQIRDEHTFIHQFADFLQDVGDGNNAALTFRDGLPSVDVTDAVLKLAKSGRWGRVSSAQQANVA